MKKHELVLIFVLMGILCFAVGAMYGCFKGAIAVEKGTYECNYINDSWHCGVKK